MNFMQTYSIVEKRGVHARTIGCPKIHTFSHIQTMSKTVGHFGIMRICQGICGYGDAAFRVLGGGALYQILGAHSPIFLLNCLKSDHFENQLTGFLLKSCKF